MRYTCTPETDLDELIGLEAEEGGGPVFRYGPLPIALHNDEELILEHSNTLSCLTIAKLQSVLRGLFIVETEEYLFPGAKFRLVLR